MAFKKMRLRVMLAMRQIAERMDKKGSVCEQATEKQDHSINATFELFEERFH